MFRSIFNRLMITYVMLVVLITGCLALFMSIGFDRYVFAEKKKVLASAAVKVEHLFKSYQNGKLSKDELQLAINNLGYLSDATIYVLKADKNSLNNQASQRLAQEISEDYLIDDLRGILNGKTVYRKKQFAQALDTDVLFYGSPLMLEQEMQGAILVFSPLNPIRSYLARINGIIGGTALLAMIISFFFISFSAARITRPIKEMEAVTRKIANGEASQELDIHTGDELEQLAISFNDMKRQVEKTEFMRREFIANVSHELRTPLTSINGFVQGMLDGLINPEQYPHYLGIIQEETQRLMRLTGDILELAKIQSGQIQLHKQSLLVREQLEKVLQSFEIPFRQKKLLVSTYCNPQLRVLADPDRLQQILHNIISNAIRYTAVGKPIRIRVNQADDNLQFIITDSGSGIKQEDLPYIFERFYRDDKSRQGHNGTGLGLSIVKNLLEIQGGSIHAESKPNQGTSIIFQLPQG